MNSAQAVRVAMGRVCGSCMMCCKAPSIVELDKPAGIWCRHAVPGNGCSIYGKHPPSCRSFHCLWLQDESFGPEWKPDRAKFVLYLQHDGPNLWAAVDPGFPNAWRKPPYHARLQHMTQARAEHGGFLFVRIGERVIAVLPDGDRDLGGVGADDEVVVARRFTPAGYAYEVEVKNRAAPTRGAAASC
jgi:hypothetical protein